MTTTSDAVTQTPVSPVSPMSPTAPTTLRGGRLDEPEMPAGRLELQPPPRIEQAEGASGVLMNAIPMLGSLGSIVLVATMAGANTGGRQYLAAGMFLFATLGFIVVQLDRQRKQRVQQVTGTRTEYLRYLGNVRQVAREAADQQRKALSWHHPDPAALPALAEEGSRLWEHGSADPQLPARPLRPLPPAAGARAGPAGERAHRPGRPGGRVRAAPAARRAPPPARPAGVHRPARLRPGRDLRARGAGPLAGAVDDLLGDRVPVAGPPRRRGAHRRPAPRPLGLAQVAAARPERPARGRGRSDADGVDVARRAGHAAAARTSASGPGSGPTSAPRHRTSCSCSTASSCRRATTSSPTTACTA